jgi:hypothetical protein
VDDTQQNVSALFSSEALVMVFPTNQDIYPDLPGTNDDGQCGSEDVFNRPECSWYDHTAQTWSTSGCTSTNFENGTTTCVCTHTTEFTVILRRYRNSCKVASPAKWIYFSYIFVYGALFVLLVTQVLRSGIYSGWKFSFPLATQSVGAVAACFKFFVCLIFSDSIGDVSPIAAAIVSMVPFMVMFWVFTLLIFQVILPSSFFFLSPSPFVCFLFSF